MSFALIQRQAPKRSHDSYLVHYVIKIVILIFQLPFIPLNSKVLYAGVANQSLMLVAFVLIYSPLAEVSLISAALIVINYLLRTLLFRPTFPVIECL